MINFQHEFFEITAKKFPNYVAVDDHGKKISYKNLDIFSDKIANFLYDNGCKVNDRVCIFTQKNTNQYASVLGILKAGSCWVPLSYLFPKERIQFLLKIIEPKFIITENIYYKKITNLYNKKITKILLIDKSESNKSFYSKKDILEQKTSKIVNNICGSDLAYIIFTSGSTGKPKGVMVTHENTSTYLNNSKKYFKPQKKLRFAHTAEITFDPSIFDVFVCWLNAGTVVPFNKQSYRINHLEFFKNNKNINVGFFVPSFFQKIQDTNKLNSPALSKMKHIIFAGEPIPKGLISNIYKSIKNVKVYNVYGTTETAIISHWYLVPKKVKHKDEISVGKELPNFKVILVNNNGKESNINESGEVYIYGPQVSPGYWRNSFLTDKQFVNHPFDKQFQYKVYKTGDLLRKDSNGIYYFVGRTDNQVKIRGNRVELEEVENCFKEIEGVIDAVSIAFNRSGRGSNSDLFSFIRVNSQKINKNFIYSKIQKKLPRFMVPTDIFIFRNDFPRTQNGKVDKKELTKKILEFLA